MLFFEQPCPESRGGAFLLEQGTHGETRDHLFQALQKEDGQTPKAILGAEVPSSSDGVPGLLATSSNDPESARDWFGPKLLAIDASFLDCKPDPIRLSFSKVKPPAVDDRLIARPTRACCSVAAK
jgi:hypothetical protein